jgi:ATP-dependent helicase/nuclease subunit A
LDSQLTLFASSEPRAWRVWWSDAVAAFPGQWLPILNSLANSNPVAVQCAAAAHLIAANLDPAALAEVFATIRLARENCRRGKKQLWIDPLEEFFAEADFLSSLIGPAGGPDPLKEDWTWVRDQMKTLLELSAEFSQAFSEAKRELGVVDFNDLEQYSLRLLWDPATQRPTGIARQWQRKLRFIFVDEYQDINAAQDRIIQALSRDGPEANRFLVGDVKQSIYRFRLANPHIFQSYVEDWGKGQGQVVPLVDNFRSREGLLDFINSVFGLLITRDLGGTDYSSEAALRFNSPLKCAELGAVATAKPEVELHLLLKGDPEIPEDEEDAQGLAELMDLLEAEKEARLVALRLRDLQSRQHPIWDRQVGQFRPVQWSDMAILLRSPAKKAESYAKEFARLNLPLQVARQGFYASPEVSDLLSLMQLLDNPLQDLPLLAVLHSPLVGLTVNELAEIRLTSLKSRFWTALTRWHRSREAEPENEGARERADTPQSKSQAAETHSRISLFLERFARWRRMVRRDSLSRCLEIVLAETHYDSWVLNQPRGAQRQANLQRLTTLAREFDQFQRQGLFRFLTFVQAQQDAETEPEVAACTSENAVRLLSIHQSKGLEFPVVVVADLGKPFNMADLRADVILDEEFGLCPQVKPPHTGKRYPSLSYWLARRRQLRELLGEELRLLYVAMTRARDTLILSGAIPRQKASNLWRADHEPDTALRLKARSYSDWLGLWFSLNVGAEAKDSLSGETQLLHWFIHDQSKLVAMDSPVPEMSASPSSELVFDSAEWRRLEHRLSWQYLFSAATRQPAKTSVSALKRQVVLGQDDEASRLWPLERERFQDRAATSSLGQFGASVPKLSSAEIGTAHHEFLQLVPLDRTGSAREMREEAFRLQKQARLTADQVAAIDFDGLAFFWNSELGGRIRAEQALVHRELAFTARFGPVELARILGQNTDSTVERESVLVQGIVDLTVITPKEIWLIDFKTDQLMPNEVASRLQMYETQLKLYAASLSRIYQRPVSECWLYFLELRRAVAIDLA